MRHKSISRKLTNREPEIGATIEMKTIVFLRHGQTDWNLNGKFQGQQDIPLNETGQSQAREAAHRWGHTEFDAAIVSPLQRAHDSARIMLRDRHVPCLLNDKIKETAGGEWEGLLFTEIAERWPDEHAAFRLPDLDAGPVGGETPRQSGGRTALAVIEALQEANVLLVVSHGNAMRAAAHLLLGYADEDYASVPRLSNCRAHVLQSDSGEYGSFTLTQTCV